MLRPVGQVGFSGSPSSPSPYERQPLLELADKRGNNWSVAAVSPTQRTAELTWTGFLVRLLFIFTLFIVITSTIPVQEIGTSTEGMQQFASGVGFTKLDGSPGTLATVVTLDDVVAYEQALVTALFPETEYGPGPGAGVYPRKDPLYVLRVHRLLGPVVVAQRRVRPTRCAFRSFRALYPECYEDLEKSETTEPFQGHDFSPELGAYAVKLTPDRAVAAQEMRSLVRGRFWDRATRETSVRFQFHNAPGHFTGYCMVKFTISPYGAIHPLVEISFLRLAPYAEVAGGHKLVMWQVAFSVMVFCVVLEIVRGLASQPHVRWSVAYALRPWGLSDCALLGLTLYCGMKWHHYLKQVGGPLLDPLDQRSFEQLAALANTFTDLTFTLSMLLLLSVLRTAEYMVIAPQLSAMYVALARTGTLLGPFAIFLVVLVGGFLLSGHVLFGQVIPAFADLPYAAFTIMLWMLTLGSGHEEVYEHRGGAIFLVLFLFICMVILLNVILAIMLGAFTVEQEDSSDEEGMTAEEKLAVLRAKLSRRKPLNHSAADWICDKIGVRVYPQDPYNIAMLRRRSRRSSALGGDAFSGLSRSESESVLHPSPTRSLTPVLTPVLTSPRSYTPTAEQP